jgi:hypothetical protein
VAQFTRAQKQHGSQATCRADDMRALVVVASPQQLTKPVWVGNRREVLHQRFAKRVLQVARRVAYDAAGGHGIAEDLTAIFQGPMRGFDRATGFDPAQNFQQLHGRDRSHRLAPNPGEHVDLQSPDDLVAVGRGPFHVSFVEPLTGHFLKAATRWSISRASLALVRASLSPVSG